MTRDLEDRFLRDAESYALEEDEQTKRDVQYPADSPSEHLGKTFDKFQRHLHNANEVKRMHRLWEEAYLKFFVTRSALSDFDDMDRESRECEDLADTAVATIMRRHDAQDSSGT